MREENRGFVDWYAGLMKHEQTFFRGEMQRLCDVSRTTVYKWLDGDVALKTPNKRIINAIAGQRLFDVEEVRTVLCGLTSIILLGVGRMLAGFVAECQCCFFC